MNTTRHDILNAIDQLPADAKAEQTKRHLERIGGGSAKRQAQSVMENINKVGEVGANELVHKIWLFLAEQLPPR